MAQRNVDSLVRKRDETFNAAGFVDEFEDDEEDEVESSHSEVPADDISLDSYDVVSEDDRHLYENENDLNNDIQQVEDSQNYELNENANLDDETNEVVPEEPGEPEEPDPNWSREYVDFDVPYFTKFTGALLKPDFNRETATPLDYFQLFFTDVIIDEIVVNTNNYAKWYRSMKRITDPNFTDKLWYDTTRQEIKAYLGLIILFGLSPSPRQRCYFSQDSFLGNNYVKSTFSEKRYEKLNQYFHVADKSAEKPRGHPQYDKLAKVRNIIDYVSKSFMEYMSPSKYIAIDESMIR